MHKASDVMSRNVVTMPSDGTVEEAIRTLLDHRISGAPVTDRDGNLLGIISEFQLLELVYEPEMREAPIGRFMTKDVLTVEEDALLRDIATIFVVHRIRRVPVVRDGRVVGLISRRDLLRSVLDDGNGAGQSVNTAKVGSR